jgi:hypothetical protein
MKRKLWGGNKPPFLSTSIHVQDDTILSIDVIMDETPTLSIGDNGYDATIFFTKASLDRTIMALEDLRRGSALIGLTWNAYVDAVGLTWNDTTEPLVPNQGTGTGTPGDPNCPIHGSTCRKVWHKNDTVPVPR